MKAIIFDVDNTLIDWKDEYVFVLRNLLLEINPNFTEDEILKIDKVIDENEKYLTELNKEIFLKHINRECKLDLSMDFLDRLIVAQGACFTEDKELVETIKYLYGKYDLYVISNWFTDTQRIRLENVGIAKYFKKIIGADINYYKPDKRCFDVILKEYKAEDCTYIGDNLNLDIIPASELGMNVIWKIKGYSDKYKTIKNINELKNIL